MERSIQWLAAAALAGLATVASASNAPAGRADLRTQGTTANLPESYGPATRFQSLDRNRSGALDRREARADPELAQHFRTADSSRDGRIDASEFAAFEPSDASAWRLSMNDTPDSRLVRDRDENRR